MSSAAMMVNGQLLTIRMLRNGDSIPWGFRIQGGSDFSIPLSIQKINPGSVAEKAGLLPGDQVCRISQKNADLLSHKQAQESILSSRNDLELTIQRGGTRLWKPQSIIRNHEGQTYIKHSLKRPDEDFSRKLTNGNNGDLNGKTINGHYQNGDISTSRSPLSPPPSSLSSNEKSSNLFNAAPKPFGFTKVVTNGFGASPAVMAPPPTAPPNSTLLQPHRRFNDINREMTESGSDSGRPGKMYSGSATAIQPPSTLKAVYQPQYNTPINMYSPANVVDAFEGQTKGVLTTGIQNLRLNKQLEGSPPIQESATYKLIHEEKPSKAKSPNGPIQSGSFRRIEDYVSDQSNSDTGTSKLNHHSRQPESHLHGNNINTITSHLYECIECSRPIIGVFVKVGDSKFLHPDCFKCSTCGTSLKSKGYFSIHDKLYCDIHARLHQNNSVIGENIDRIANNTSSTLSHIIPNSLRNNQINPKIPANPLPPPFLNKNILHSPQKQSSQPFNAPADNFGQHQPIFNGSSRINLNNNLSPSKPEISYQQTPTNNTILDSSNLQTQVSSSDRNYDMNLNRVGGGQPWNPPGNNMNPANYYASINNPPLRNIGTDSAQFSMTQIKPNREGVGIGYPTSEPGVIGAANAGIGGGTAESNKTMMRRGHGIYNESHIPGVKVPICEHCHNYIRGPYISALNKAWCPNHFLCSNPSCNTPLQTIGFVEEKGKIYCEHCYEKYFAPRCSKCGGPILRDCLNALDRPWHPECFSCAHCHKPFGNSTFYMENGQPYCERDWNNLFTIKCDGCRQPIRANERWVEALNKSFHSNCFICTVCHKPLEGQSFFAKDGLPFCKLHVR